MNNMKIIYCFSFRRSLYTDQQRKRTRGPLSVTDKKETKNDHFNANKFSKIRRGAVDRNIGQHRRRVLCPGMGRGRRNPRARGLSPIRRLNFEPMVTPYAETTTPMV